MTEPNPAGTAPALNRRRVARARQILARCHPATSAYVLAYLLADALGCGTTTDEVVEASRKLGYRLVKPRSDVNVLAVCINRQSLRRALRVWM